MIIAGPVTPKERRARRARQWKRIAMRVGLLALFVIACAAIASR